MMDSINFKQIPVALQERKQWILWKYADRGGKPTKVPVQADGTPAKSNDAETWSDFQSVCSAFHPSRFAGIGFVFSADDPFCGIDLDGCRDPQTGKVADWAKRIILEFGSYAEVSPSKTGVKIFCFASSPFAGGRKKEIQEAKIVDKVPAIEVYDRLRYFALTGWGLKGLGEVRECQGQLEKLKAQIWPDEPTQSTPTDFRGRDAVVDRARKYLAKIPPAVSGQDGHGRTFHAACVLVLGFELDTADATQLLMEYNERCAPPWPEKEIARKVREAAKQPGPRGYLRNTAPDNWQRVSVPNYKEAPPQPEPRTTTIVDASRSYIELIRRGEDNCISTTIPDLDYALGGGVEFGEMVIFAARPSHGKSAVALQCIHGWTEIGMPCAIVSEEMSALMLGRRTLQHVSPLPQEHWKTRLEVLERDITTYSGQHAKCFIAEGCGTARVAVDAIEKHVDEDGVRCAVVDYAQLLRSEGKSRYEQITNTSILLRQLASRKNIVLLVLCQLNRAVEQRGGSFSPVMSDLRDTGQLEQDADVISFLCWPFRLDGQQPRNKFEFYIGKNRNRGSNGESLVTCRFDPERQKFMDALPESFDGPPDSHSYSDRRSASSN